MATSEYPDTIWAGPPRAYGTGRDGKAVRLSVVHYTAGASGPGTARNGAAYDARRTDGTSCHAFHDSAESVQEVWTRDRSNSAYSKGNRLGIHHELCATAQPRSWWLAGVGLATLTRAARASAWDCRTYNLEPRRLTVPEVRAAWYSFPNGPRGICGHVDITRAFPEDGGSHTDPGDGFPWDVYIATVRRFLAGGTNPTTLEDDMAADFDTPNPNTTEPDGVRRTYGQQLTDIFNALHGKGHPSYGPDGPWQVVNLRKAAVAPNPVAMTAADRDTIVAGIVAGLAANTTFLGAVAKAVADENARRQQA